MFFKKKKLDICFYGNPVLKKKSAEVLDVNNEIVELAQGMIPRMIDSDGIGLAGPQVGRNQRIVALNIPFDDENSQQNLFPEERLLYELMPVVVVNPKILNTSQEMTCTSEGCLSIPGINADVERSAEIEIEFDIIIQNNTIVPRRKMRFWCGQLTAVCFQHEVDHLDGILFVDRVSEKEKQRIAGKLKKLKKIVTKSLKKNDLNNK
ncbi:MAG: peptide deformylase [Verrucomicrobiota bacterium]|nr:peptide deformylase [Verrucomicrobiota bacterium]